MNRADLQRLAGHAGLSENIVNTETKPDLAWRLSMKDPRVWGPAALGIGTLGTLGSVGLYKYRSGKSSGNGTQSKSQGSEAKQTEEGSSSGSSSQI
jgi:hypothetical protein